MATNVGPVIGDWHNPGTSKYEIKLPGGQYNYGPSKWFEASYIPADSQGDKHLDPGLILARAYVGFDASYGAIYKYVPYSATAAYGTGSDTAVGILDDRLMGNSGDAGAIAPLVHGQVQQRNCYVLGEAKGTIAAGIKTALKDIYWWV